MTTTAETAPAPKVRITKDPDVRREELLDIAFELCRTQGFEALRVEHIVQQAGVAKGTFYHYFASKDAVLEALIQRFGEGLFAQLSSAAEGSGSAAQRLHAVMQAAAAFKLGFGEIALASLLMREENAGMRVRVYRSWREDARRVLLPLVKDGAADGSFDLADANGATDIVLLLWFEAGDQLWERALLATTSAEFTEVMLNGSAEITQAQERVLGVAPGTFTTPVTPQIVAMTHQLFETLKGKQS